jgi:hypothetical protein
VVAFTRYVVLSANNATRFCLQYTLTLLLSANHDLILYMIFYYWYLTANRVTSNIMILTVINMAVTVPKCTECTECTECTAVQIVVF